MAVMPVELWIADIINAIALFIGMLILLRFLKKFGGLEIRKYSVWIGVGILFYAIFHEGGEVLYGSGLHGGFPKTLWGSFHIVFFGIIGSLIFLIGSYMFTKKVFAAVEEHQTDGGTPKTRKLRARKQIKSKTVF